MFGEKKNKSFIDRIPKSRRDEFEKRVRGLIEEAFRSAADPNLTGHVWRSCLGGDGVATISPHNPDWCQAFGLVQGVAMICGYDMWNNQPGSARRWLDDLSIEYGRKWYDKIKAANERGFDLCSCGRPLVTTSKCPVCDRDE